MKQGAGGISKDPFDSREDVEHGTGPEWGEEKDRAFAEQNAYFFFCFTILYYSFFQCILSWNLKSRSCNDDGGGDGGSCGGGTGVVFGSKFLSKLLNSANLWIIIFVFKEIYWKATVATIANMRYHGESEIKLKKHKSSLLLNIININQNK